MKNKRLMEDINANQRLTLTPVRVYPISRLVLLKNPVSIGILAFKKDASFLLQRSRLIGVC